MSTTEIDPKILEEVTKLAQSSEGLAALATELRRGRNLHAELEASFDMYAPKHPNKVGPVEGIDKSGKTIALAGRWGGDLIDFVRFKDYSLDKIAESVTDPGIKERILSHQRVAGIYHVDVEGHSLTKSGYLAQLSRASLRAKIVPFLRSHGHIPAELFEEINNEVHYLRERRSLMTSFSWLELELNNRRSEVDGRFIIGGQPMFILCRGATHKIDDEIIATWQPSDLMGVYISPFTVQGESVVQKGDLVKPERYAVNKFSMRRGDILVCPSDGVTEHGQSFGTAYSNVLPRTLEKISREEPNATATRIRDLLLEDMHTYSLPIDDRSILVIKKT